MSLNEDPKPMVGQVGGVAVHKKPLLTLKPDYVLKPLLSDFRGIREIAFYEAIRTVSHKPMNSQLYANFLRGSPQPQGAVYRVGEFIDTLAVASAIWWHDPVVMQSEIDLKDAWRKVKREMEILQKLSKFTAPYYGVLGQVGVSDLPQFPYGITDEAHLLLQDLTSNFAQPCVMDLKLGVQTYEPVSVGLVV
jgi:Inositol polyphosphate kinase